MMVLEVVLAQLLLLKIKKEVSSYSFSRASAVGGGVEICQYDSKFAKKNFWFARFSGDYRLPLLVIDENGKKRVLNGNISFYKIAKSSSYFGIMISEIDGLSAQLYDLKKDKIYFKYSMNDLKKFFSEKDWDFSVYGKGKRFYLIPKGSEDVIEFDIESKSIKKSV